MGRKSKYKQLLAPLLTRDSFTVAQAEAVGIPRHALAYLVKQGTLERLAKGHYRATFYTEVEDVAFEGLALTASTVSNGVVCLISALKVHNLTEEIPDQYWIAVPFSQYPPARPLVRIVRMRNIELGKVSISLAGVKVSIFDPERCIVDAFRYLSQEIAIKALKAYLFDRSGRPDLRKLNEYAKKLRISLDPYLTALMT